MILCLGTTPAVQRVMVFRALTLDAVNRALTTLDGAAGKSINVAKVLSALDAHPLAVGFLGGDRGECVRAALEERGIEHEFVRVAARTRQCLTVLDQTARTQTELVEESQAVAPADYDLLASIARRRLPGCRALILSGTLTPGGPVDFYARATAWAEEAGALSVVDAQGKPLLEALNARPGLVKPNRVELSATVQRELPDESAVLRAMRELRERGAQRVVVTAGKGATLAYDGLAAWRVSSPKIDALNPIGSGDAFTAALTWRLVEGDDLGEACRWGAAAGGGQCAYGHGGRGSQAGCRSSGPGGSGRTAHFRCLSRTRSGASGTRMHSAPPRAAHSRLRSDSRRPEAKIWHAPAKIRHSQDAPHGEHCWKTSGSWAERTARRWLRHDGRAASPPANPWLLQRTKRMQTKLVLCAAALMAGCALVRAENGVETPMAPGPFKGTDESLAQYRCPDWFRDAKFGIWAHWGPQAVPMDGDWYARGMYEPGNGHYKYHLAHYGHPSTNGYKDIIPLWKAEKWDPDRLMALYKKAGARYFVSMGSHHDNFFLWDSKIHRWNAVQMGPHRDVVGEWQKAAKKYGLRFGVSEHLGASFTWFQSSHRSDTTGPMAGVPYDGADPKYQDLYHFPARPDDKGWYSKDPRWHQIWYNSVKELVDLYHPDLLYTDGGVPFGNEVGRSLIAHLYNLDLQGRDKLEAVYTCKQESKGMWVEDLERGVMPRINPNPWQTDTSIGDWYYNRNWKFRPVSWSIHMLVDIVSKNGNLLLNVVQRPDGSLDPQVESDLEELARWIAIHGEAIYDTRPWAVYGEGRCEGQRRSFQGRFQVHRAGHSLHDQGRGALRNGSGMARGRPSPRAVARQARGRRA